MRGQSMVRDVGRRGRRRARLSGAVASVMLAGAVLACAAAPSQGADTTPRPLGANPNNRGYELVSPPGVELVGSAVSAMTSTVDGRVLVTFVGGIPGATSGTRAAFVAERGTSGWSFRNALPSEAAFAQDDNSAWFGLGVTPDLSRLLYGLVPAPLAPDIWQSFVLATSPDDTTTIGRTDHGTSFYRQIAGSSDLRHVYAPLRDDLAADDTGGPDILQIYDLDLRGDPVLVSRMPGSGGPGDPVSPCGVDGTYTFAGDKTRNWASTDGSRIYFAAAEGPFCGPFDATGVYLRDRGDLSTLADDTTVRLDRPLSGTPSSAFIGANEAGTRAIFASNGRLDVVAGTPEDANNSWDLYRFTVGAGIECLTCIVPEVDLQPPGSPQDFARYVATDRDIDVAYFYSTRVLADGAIDGEHNLYLVKDHRIRFVATTSASFQRPALSRSGHAGDITPDGTVLVFGSRHPSLNDRTGTDNGGHTQYYRFDAAAPEDQALTCISCPRDRPAGTDVDPLPLGSMGDRFMSSSSRRMMTDNGQIIVFKTNDDLVPWDTNEGEDIYEWSNGTLTLLSDGVTPGLTGTKLVLEVSPDGRDIFVASMYDSLIPGVPGEPGTIYDVRAGGGFPVQSADRPCEGDSCQGPLTGTRTLPRAASDSVSREPGATLPDPAFTVRRITRAQRTRLARRGVITLTVRANVPGTITARATARVKRRGRVVARQSRSLSGAGTAKLKLVLSRAARRELRATRRLRVRIAVSFSETAEAKTRRVVLRAKKGKRPHKKAGSATTRGRGEAK